MSSPKVGKPKITEAEPVEDIKQVKQDEVVAEEQRKRKTILSARTGGKQSTILSGIQTALKKRLGA